MRTMWTNIITGWNFIKIIRVLAGISILTSGITDNNTAFILIGSFFLLYSLITPGVCCGVYDPPPQQKASTDLKNVEYEELGVK